MRGSTIRSLRDVAFPQYHRDGDLTVFPCEDPAGVPFRVVRVFTIGEVAVGGSRGHHAHRTCTQLVACFAGRAEVRVDDGQDTRSVVLQTPGIGLLIPPGLWNVITFAAPTTVIGVFCDRPYDEGDYIRDRAEFLREKAKPEDSLDARRRI